MTQKVEISRTELPAPTMEKPKRVLIQIQYQVGMLPPHFVYIDKDEWTEAKEKEEIKKDLDKVMARKPTIIEI